MIKLVRNNLVRKLLTNPLNLQNRKLKFKVHVQSQHVNSENHDTEDANEKFTILEKSCPHTEEDQSKLSLETDIL